MNNGIISLVLEIIGAKPKMPNSIPHNGERRAKNPIDMIWPSFLGAAANPATNPPKIEVHKVHIYCSFGNPGTTWHPPLLRQIFTELIASNTAPSSP